MNGPQKVLLLAQRLDLGGSERQMTEVAKGLDRSRFAPHIGCFHAEGVRVEELRAAGIPILALPVRSFLSAAALRAGWELMRYIRQQEIRLVHSFDVPMTNFGVPFARMAREPVVLSSQRAHRELAAKIHRRVLRMTDRMVDGIVVNCLYMRDHLVQEERVDPELIHLCYNGIDFSQFHREGARSPLPYEGTTIGVVCALRPEKGLLTLVRAFAVVSRQHSSARLLFVGSGPMLPALQEECARLDIEDRTLFIPKTSEVAQWMRAIDIFVLPSLSEALSNSLMEAMACGCCCVASRVGGNPELIGEETQGLLFPRGDESALASALLRLVGDSALRTRLAQAGHEFIHQGFSQSQSVRRMAEIYTSFLAGR